ncbi:MAG: hypothetical protein WD509_03010 [Candidatus Paceibacterota bacterium]
MHRYLYSFVALLVIVLLAGCQTTSQTAPNSTTIKNIPFGESFSLITSPIHLGDDRGKIEDVERFKNAQPATEFVGSMYTWEFDLALQPEKGVLDISIFSLSEGCPTSVFLNGHALDNIHSFGNVGNDMTTDASMEIKGVLFRAGKNKLSVGEEECMTGTSSSWNDSVVKKIQLRVK